ncbi:hypothetical protein AAFG13_00185 [Bradyrhizobium sp. B124]|uniref:hypothetical protein n=1 Tax=Bradyrhizobium sp. B124 TaxID=3140245 RepID=UPI003182C392
MVKSGRADKSAISHSIPSIAPPITALGVAKYAGLLSAGISNEILVTGSLPRGETTQNVTYFVVDQATKTIVSQVILPDASDRFNAVEMRVKVGRYVSAYDIGTFNANGEFTVCPFLSVRSSLNLSPPGGPSSG